MDIESQVAQLRKKLEKIQCILTDGTALRKKKREQKEEEVKALKEQLVAIEKKLTELKVTKINIKLHVL